jgi:predicted dehydrogenase
MNQSFGVIGGGWRAEFFLRIARDLPAQFPLVGMVVRDPAKRQVLEELWPGPFFASLEELLEYGKPGFVVTSVSWSSNLPLIEFLAGERIPVLSETPIAPSLEELQRVFELEQSGARIQLAEQYIFQPLHAARLKIVRDGRLGPVHEADVSCAHGYHGISLLRNYLQVGLRLPRISARSFRSKIVASPNRNGPPKAREIVDSDRIIAQFDYGDKLGIFDFTGDQYFSWIRSPRIMVRGEEGEINNSTVHLLKDFQTAVRFDLVRQDAGEYGNLEGLYHRSIVGGSEIFYENPFPGARWIDDEIAVATSMAKMQTFVETGESFYGAAEACHDRYLDILIGESIKSGEPVQAVAQAWTVNGEQ